MSLHGFWFMLHNRHTCLVLAESWRQVCSVPAERLYSIKRLDSFFPPSCAYSTFAQLTPPLLCTSFLFLCMCLWYKSAVFAFLVPLDAPHRLFDEAPSLPLAHSNKKSLCVFHISCCHPVPLEIRGPRFMHGFSECQLPTHSWIGRSMKEGWENQVFGGSHRSCWSFFPQGRRMKPRNSKSRWKTHFEIFIVECAAVDKMQNWGAERRVTREQDFPVRFCVVHSCGDVEKRKQTAICRTDRKIAIRTATLTAPPWL